MTHEERELRKAEILKEMETEGADLKALEEEARALSAEDVEERNAEAEKAEIRSKVAAIGGEIEKNFKEERPMNETRATALHETGKASYTPNEVRSVLVSGGQLATPTGVAGINDINGEPYSSLVDMVSVVDCNGMGSNKVAYVDTDAAFAANQTEGSPAADKEPVFGYVTIQPESIACKAQISKQARKQSPLNYEAKVTAQSMISLKKAAVKKIVAKLKASALNTTVAATLASSKGSIDEKTLRNIVLAYGGDEAVMGEAVLLLNKTDLIAFGDVRGAQEKKAVYDIIPDGANPNTGIIKDGGLSVRYVICSELTACKGTSQSSSAAQPTMFYGNPKNFELDLFSDYEIAVSHDFAFTSLMDTIVGDCEIGGDVVVKNGFVAYTIAKA